MRTLSRCNFYPAIGAFCFGCDDDVGCTCAMGINGSGRADRGDADVLALVTDMSHTISF